MKIYRFAVELIARFKAHRISERSGELAYFLLLSFFPFLILLNTAIAALNISPEIINTFLSPLFPKNVTELIVSYNNHIVQNTNNATVSLGILFVVYSSSKAIRTFNKILLAAYDVAKKLSYIRTIILALTTTLGLGILSAFSIALITFISVPVSNILAHIHPFFSSVPFIKTLTALFLLTVSVIMLNLIHYIATFGKIAFRSFLPGSILSVIAVCIAGFGFALYFNNFSNFSAIYGAISAVMLLVLWLYLFSIVIAVGAEFNALLIENKNNHPSSG